MDDSLIMGRYPATTLTDEDIERDEHGYTHPNLHRRIDPHTIHNDTDHMEFKPRQYTIGILSTNSYRTTEMFTHDEDSETSEVP